MKSSQRYQQMDRDVEIDDPPAAKSLLPAEHGHFCAWSLRLMAVLFAVVYSIAFQYAFENSFCDLMFSCGCTFPWSGGDGKCNVYNAVGPRCPFCASDPRVGWLAWWIPIVAMALPLIKRPRSVARSFFMYVFATLLCGLLILFFGSPSYGYFLGFGERPPTHQ